MSGLNFLLWTIAGILITLFLCFMICLVSGFIIRNKAVRDYRKRKNHKCRECKKWGTWNCPNSEKCFATGTKPYFEKV